MTRTYFTQEQIDNLRQSPYVTSVSEKTIKYSDDLKKLYYQRRSQGEMPTSFFKSIGLGPDMIGQKRIKSLTANLNKYASYEAYIDARVARKSPEKISEKEELKYLRHKATLLEQENKFLKKNLWINPKKDSH